MLVLKTVLVLKTATDQGFTSFIGASTSVGKTGHVAFSRMAVVQFG